MTVFSSFSLLLPSFSSLCVSPANSAFNKSNLFLSFSSTSSLSFRALSASDLIFECSSSFACFLSLSSGIFASTSAVNSSVSLVAFWARLTASWRASTFCFPFSSAVAFLSDVRLSVSISERSAESAFWDSRRADLREERSVSRSELTAESVCCNCESRSSNVICGVAFGGVPGTVRLGDVDGVESGSEDEVELSGVGDSGSVCTSASSSSEPSVHYELEKHEAIHEIIHFGLTISRYLAMHCARGLSRRC